MFDVMVEMLAHVGTLFLNTGQDQEPRGSAHPFITPWQAFRCRDERYIVVAPREEHFWSKMCNRPRVRHGRWRRSFRRCKSRQTHREELLPELRSIFVGRDSAAWLEVLRAEGCLQPQ